MTKIIYFDIAALCINVVILFSFYFRKMTKGTSNALLMLNTLNGIVVCILDIWAVTLDFNGMRMSYPYILKYIPDTLYLFFHTSNIFLYTLYNISVIDLWQIMLNKTWFWIVHIGGVCLIFILLLVNFKYHIIFRINSDGIYERGDYFFIIYIYAALIFFCSLMFVLQHKFLYNPYQYKCVIGMYPILIIAIVIQMIFPFMLIELFSISLVLLLIMQTIQRPEVFTENITGLYNMNAFVTDVERLKKTKFNRNIIFIKIKNENSLRSLLSYEHYNSMIRRVGGVILSLANKDKNKYKIYYLDYAKFALVSKKDDEKSALILGKEINDALSKPICFNHINVDINSYTCVVNFPKDFDKIRDLISFSNSFYNSNLSGNLFMAKDIYSDRDVYINANIDKIIERAYLANNFRVYYQPIYSVKKGRFNSAEALLRLYDEKYGFISPNIFIPAAEKSGAIIRIGNLVLKEVMKFVASKDFEKIGLDYVEINISVQQCLQIDMADNIINYMKSLNINPSKINLEITESIASHSQAVVMKNLFKLHEYGISFSLDDFGTGYSNVRRLGILPISVVKIDRLFVLDYKNEIIKVILKNMIKMFKELDLQILIEGIESKEQLEEFIKFGCDYVQGFFFSMPLKYEDFIYYIDSVNSKGIGYTSIVTKDS